MNLTHLLLFVNMMNNGEPCEKFGVLYTYAINSKKFFEGYYLLVHGII